MVWQEAKDDLDEHHAALRSEVRFKLLGRSSLGHSEIKNRAGLEHGFSECIEQLEVHSNADGTHSCGGLRISSVSHSLRAEGVASKFDF